MKELTPNYYKKFRCIADKCRHSCCVGWEIDIDENTLSYYNSLNTEIGERIRRNIGGDTPHFILSDNERCPFLNEKGLCDIITECGEEALCDICRLHPRFCNFFDSFTETGLGLCCEEAARIILSEKEKFSIDLPDIDTVTDEEKDFLIKRKEVFDILQDRDKSIYDRFCILAEKYGFEFDFSLSDLCDIYISLERLDQKWAELLEGLKDRSSGGSIFKEKDFSLPFEQLSCYFVFRHLTDGLWYKDYAERIKFVLISCYIIGALTEMNRDKVGTLTLEEMTEIVRMYSSEIEYSEENIESLLSL